MFDRESAMRYSPECKHWPCCWKAKKEVISDGLGVIDVFQYSLVTPIIALPDNCDSELNT